MEKESASYVIEAIVSMSRPIDQILAEVHALPEGEEKKDMMKAMNEVMGLLTFHFVFPLVKQHPELDPDK